MTNNRERLDGSIFPPDFLRIEKALNRPELDDHSNMLDTKTFSFVVKIWFEPMDPKTRILFWRGHITHVPSGERRYVKSLVEIPRFIAGYLEAAGAHIGFFWRLQRWFKR